MEYNGFIYKEYRQGYEIIGYEENEKDLVIPSYIHDKEVIKIHDKAFMNNQIIESVIIPDTVIYLGRLLFEGCHHLKELTLSKNIYKLKWNTIGTCPLLAVYISLEHPYYTSYKGVLYNKELTKIEYVPEGITDLYLPDTIKEISGLGWCHNLKSIHAHHDKNKELIEDYINYALKELESQNRIEDIIISIDNKESNN